MQSNFELLMTKKDLKDVLITPKHFDLANEVIDLTLRCLNSYRRDYPVITRWQLLTRGQQVVMMLHFIDLI